MNDNFEKSMKELEEISEKLASGDVSLEDSIKLFENGMKISKKCQDMLENAEKKVTILVSDKNGEIKEEAFETEV